MAPDPPTFATDLPAALTAIAGIDKSWNLPSIHTGDFGFNDPITITEAIMSGKFSITIGTPHTLNFAGTLVAE